MLDKIKYWNLVQNFGFKNRILKSEIDKSCDYANSLYLKILNDYSLKVLNFSYNPLKTYVKGGHFRVVKNIPNSIRINIATLIIQTKQNYLKKIRQTVLHELAHYIQYEKFGFSDHSEIFYNILEELLRKYPNPKLFDYR